VRILRWWRFTFGKQRGGDGVDGRFDRSRRERKNERAPIKRQITVGGDRHDRGEHMGAQAKAHDRP